MVEGDLAAITPFVTEKALQQLKFAELLPPDLARQTLQTRLSDAPAAWQVLRFPVAAFVG